MIWGPFQMAKDKKQSRPKAETPKGFRDYFDQEVSERNEMLQQVARVYHHHGFDALETSAVENVDALGKFLPDVDRPNDGVFAWQEDDNSWLALRYDLTAPLARVYAQYRNELPNPYRSMPWDLFGGMKNQGRGVLDSSINVMQIQLGLQMYRRMLKFVQCWQMP